MSSSLLPSTPELADLFLAEMSASSRLAFEARLAPGASASERYQSAARFLARQHGEKDVTRVIRAAIARAWIGSGTLVTEADAAEAAEKDTWSLPPAHRNFADFYSRLPGHVRGPIVTTNFDPFIEVALREVGIKSRSYSVSYDSPPEIGALEADDAIPVVHIHGYFTGKWSLNSAEQLSRPRPGLETFLEAAFADSTVLVLGYGGWDDSVMRVLAGQARQDRIFDAEIVWAAHSTRRDSLFSNDNLRLLEGTPGFQAYLGIDASDLFVPTSVSASRRAVGAWTPRGFSLLPVEVHQPVDPLAFTNGALPGWADGSRGQWPQLEATDRLRDAVDAALASGSGGVVAAIGPMGEGKSTALRQVAATVSTRSDVLSMWREVGAPPLSRDALEQVFGAKLPIVIFVDDADQAQMDLVALSAAPGDALPIVLVVAAQDRLWWNLPRSVTANVDPILFDGLSEGDAFAIARRWDALGLSPSERVSVDEVATALVEASGRAGNKRRSSLFGAILEVRGTKQLDGRVFALLDALDTQVVKLGATNASGVTEGRVTLADVFGAICLMQTYVGDAAEFSSGATRSLIFEMAVGGASQFDAAIFRALGREASVVFSQDRVFARHPMIARAAVAWLARHDRTRSVARLIGRSAGTMKAAGADRDEWIHGLRLAENLPDWRSASSSALGSIEGASDYLQPRVIYLTVARRLQPAIAEKYMEKVGSLIWASRDRDTAARVLLNEMAGVAFGAARIQLSVGLSALALHNETGRPTMESQASYALGSLARGFRALMLQSPSTNVAAAILVKESSRRLASGYRQHVAPHLERVEIPADVAGLSLRTLLDRLGVALAPFAKHAVAELGLPFGPGGYRASVFQLIGRPNFSDLEQLDRS